MKPHRTRTEWLLSAPSLIWMTLFFLVPALIVGVLAFRPADPLGGAGAGWTLDHWRALLEDQYRPILWRTLWVSAATSFLCVMLAIPCALVMARARGAWKNALLLLIVVPFWTNFLIRVFAWKSLLHPEGPVTRAFLALGLMGEDSQLLYNNGAVLLVMVYTQLPFAILPLYAAAEKFDFGLLEAARDLGASARRAVWLVFLPSVSRGIGTAVLATFVATIGMYVVPDIVGGTDAEMLGNRIALRVGSSRNLPFASAMAAAMLAMVLLVMAVQSLCTAALKRKERGPNDDTGALPPEDATFTQP